MRFDRPQERPSLEESDVPRFRNAAVVKNVTISRFEDFGRDLIRSGELVEQENIRVFNHVRARSGDGYEGVVAGTGGMENPKHPFLAGPPDVAYYVNR